MSDFMPGDILPNLWEEILKRHWRFLETEENIQKLEERRKLEGCIKELLSIVRHDRKFFLPETSHVLRRSIRDLKDFSAQKAFIGFELISQYANNLFTKPWRKEFRVLKMYSGFYQHEIKSNLVDAEKLFEAMGYRRLSEDILVLDGPICPDQVANVSRDAMAAYVECQIMKHIYAGLDAMGLTCSWHEVYQYRERHVGSSSQAIKSLAYAIQERRLRKEPLLSADNCEYANTQQQQVVMAAPVAVVPPCQHCVPCHATHAPALPPPPPPSLTNGQCAVHTNNSCALYSSANLMYNNFNDNPNNKLIASYSANSYPYPNVFAAPGPQPHITHTRSLEHYNEAPVALVPHRHSFDHQQQGCTATHHYQQLYRPPNMYESPYDCIDGGNSLGGSSVSYAAVAAAGANCNVNAAYSHPYNVSGNRYPLPYNISSQLNSFYETPAVTCNGIKGDLCASVDNHTYAAVSKGHNCANVVPVAAARYAKATAMSASKDLRQSSFPSDRLIEYDDRAPLATHDYYALPQHNAFDYEHERSLYEQQQQQQQQRRERQVLGRGSLMAATCGQQPMDNQAPQQHLAMVPRPLGGPLPSSDDGFVYARPAQRGSRLPKRLVASSSTNSTDTFPRTPEVAQVCVDNNGLLQTELKERSAALGGGSVRRFSAQTGTERDTSEVSCESAYDDFVTVGHSEKPHHSPTQASKNQDGVGSFESWDFVFQNLERAGYSKDLGDREDLLMRSLDLDSLHLGAFPNGSAGITGSGEKRRPTHGVETKGTRLVNGGEKAKTLEKTTPMAAAGRASSKVNGKQERSILKQQQYDNVSGGSRKIKSALKTSTNNTNSNSNSNNNASTNVTDSRNGNGNNNSNSNSNGNNNALTNNDRRPASGPKANQGRSATKEPPVAASMQVINGKTNEWSCRFCTFLNPDTKRICEICCRSKDFNLEPTVSQKRTCV